jgi:hypothetical protein
MRLDLILSTWVFIWFILYGFKIIPYNPSLILILSFVAVFFEIFLLLYYGTHVDQLVKFIVINVVIIKLMPVLSLALSNNLSVTINDIYFTIFILFIYTMYLYANNIDAKSYYKVLIDAYVSNKRDLQYDNPMYRLYNNTYDYMSSRILT